MIIGMSGMAEFGALIRRAREQSGLTGVELAPRVGRPHSFIARVEGGKFSNPPDPRDFDALSRELRISKEAMLEAMGYLDPPDMDAETLTITLRSDDPRVDLLRLLEGTPDDGVRNITGLLGAMSIHTGGGINANTGVSSRGRDDTTEPPNRRIG